MSYYELMVIFSSTLTEEEERAQTLQVEELLKREKANMHLVDHWGKRKLAYPIKKQRQGYYEWYYFELESSRLAEIDRKLKMSEVILRFMAIRMEKTQIQNLLKEIARRAESAEAQAQAQVQAQPETPAAPVDDAVTLVEDTQPEEIAENIEEIVADPETEE